VLRTCMAATVSGKFAKIRKPTGEWKQKINKKLRAGRPGKDGLTRGSSDGSNTSRMGKSFGTICRICVHE